MLLTVKCPKCGETLAVDDNKSVAVCYFCGEAFIVQEAINNYNTYNITDNNTTHNYGDNTIVNVYEDESEDFVIEDGVLKEYLGADVDVVIPEGVIAIGRECFINSKIASVTIPSSVTNFDKYDFGDFNSDDCAFSLCTNLTSINVDKDNIIYSSVGGVLFSKDKTTLFQYPAGKTDSEYSIPDTVTSIGSSAFRDCTNLERIIIPYGVTDIYDSAFKGCTSLKSFIITDSVTSIGRSAFEDCTNLEVIVLCEGVASIGDRAFHACKSLTSIVMPDTVTNIGSGAFHDCTSLADITMGYNVTSIGVNAFNDTSYYNNPSNWENSVLYIGKHLVKAKEKIFGSLNIKDGTKTIADSAFYKCDNLVLVTIPDGVTSIGNSAFNSCTCLTSIVIPDSVIGIGASAFYGCTNLTDVTIGEGVTYISPRAFRKSSYYDNPSNWENNVLYIGNHLIEAKAAIFGSYVVKHGIKTIADLAFSNCDNLTSITIPETVISIGRSAFSNCPNLTSVTIPENVKIGFRAFHDYWKSKGLCVHCGGTFKGLFPKTCNKCGSPKIY